MNEPTQPPGPPSEQNAPPSPFDRPTLEPERRRGPGVGKPLLIGCGVLLLLVLAAGLLFVAYQNQIAGWLFETLQAQLEPMVPEDLPPDVRERYDRAFDAAITALRSGEYDPSALREAQMELSSVARDLSDESEMSVEDVERLSAALEKLAGGAPPDGG
ncbi:MAG: hypothetical protein PVG07_07530 [Acidobacteriota bacterium]|jgi:hypothetical protein